MATTPILDDRTEIRGAEMMCEDQAEVRHWQRDREEKRDSMGSCRERWPREVPAPPRGLAMEMIITSWRPVLWKRRVEINNYECSVDSASGSEGERERERKSVVGRV